VTRTATASAPASTANLGPGYDCIAMALAPRCVVAAEAGPEWAVVHTGRHRPGGADDAVLAAAQHVSDQPLHLTVANDIPIAKGLGSSAAAAVAGVAAALLATEGEANPDRIFRLAAEMEGHPEQVAAAVYGGLVLIPAEGLPIRLPLHPSLRPLVAVPDGVLETVKARAAVDGSQPIDVVVRSLSRMSALTAGLVTGDPGLLAAAHGDEIHEAPRVALSPEVDALIGIARGAGAYHAARSGSGPSVLAIVGVESAEQVRAAFERAGAVVVDSPMDTTGLVTGLT
jgi:homoserine kinase